MKGNICLNENYHNFTSSEECECFLEGSPTHVLVKVNNNFAGNKFIACRTHIGHIIMDARIQNHERKLTIKSTN